ncbi:hypothetical protein HII36_45300, partial [Nonomuraea sp. NN258]|uniref:hypothetical protein n=1 Tax=Nonomuraea antri TaxID=2730852 RepID=UPI001C2C30BE
PAPALATPTNCTIWADSSYAYSKCTGGTGEHMIGVEQWHPWAGPILLTGEWAAVGQVSSVRLTPYTIRRTWINKRG